MDETVTVELQPIERDAVLAGLRLLQAMLEGRVKLEPGKYAEMRGVSEETYLLRVATDSGSRLNPDQIESLVDEINCA